MNVKDVEAVSKKSGKTALSAEAQAPSQETKQPESAPVPSVPSGQPAQVATPETSEQQQPAPSPLENLKARMLTPATVEKAKVVGLDLQPLLDYATDLEVRHMHEQEFEKQVEKAFQHVGVALDKIAPLGELAEKYKQAQTQPQGQAQPMGGGLGISIPQLLQAIMSGGGGGSDETTKWLAEVGKEQIMLSRVVFQEFAKQIVPDVMEKMKAAAAAAALKP
jgi:hypothetical protein